MKKYTVKEVSDLAGISIRTLHYYDEIDLLKPSMRGDSGYRYYERKELLLLQQILFYKELQFPLEKIREILHSPGFDLPEALISHKNGIKMQLKGLKKLIHTIDKTLVELKTKEKTMNDEELYEGFTPEQISVMREEVKDRWGEKELLQSENRVRELGKVGWNDAKKKGEQIDQLLGELSDMPPDNLRVQQAVELHYKHMNIFYEVSKERYLGLANMYVQDSRFRDHYEKVKSGLAEFLKMAIEVFCHNDLQVKGPGESHD